MALRIDRSVVLVMHSNTKILLDMGMALERHRVPLPPDLDCVVIPTTAETTHDFFKGEFPKLERHRTLFALEMSVVPAMKMGSA